MNPESSLKKTCLEVTGGSKAAGSQQPANSQGSAAGMGAPRRYLPSERTRQHINASNRASHHQHRPVAKHPAGSSGSHHACALQALHKAHATFVGLEAAVVPLAGDGHNSTSQCDGSRPAASLLHNCQPQSASFTAAVHTSSTVCLKLK